MKIQAAVPDLWLLLRKVIKEYLGFMVFFKIVLVSLLLLGSRKVTLKKSFEMESQFLEMLLLFVLLQHAIQIKLDLTDLF